MDPIARDLILVGGGHSHVLLLRMLAMQPIPGLVVTLISPEHQTPYSGLLPGYVAGHYTEDEVYIDLVPLCRFAGARFIRAAVTGVDPIRQTVASTHRPLISYDLLSIDIGITPVIPRQMTDIVAVKPISQFLYRWREFLGRLAASDPVNDIAVVGGGAGGVELCLAIHHYLTSHFPSRGFNFHLVTDGLTLLPGFATGVRRRMEALIAARGIIIHRDFRAASQAPGKLISDTGKHLVADEIFWVTHGGASEWPGTSGLSTNADGFIRVRDTLQTEFDDRIFAVGDCATMINHPRPKAGVYAVRQGKPLYRNIRAMLLGKPLQNYHPQKQFLSLVSTGGKRAVASRGVYLAAGSLVWQWKDWIDQRFMGKFRNYPKMESQPVNSLLAEFDPQMQCGGCGSKVAANLLAETLSELGINGEVEDAAVITVPAGKVLLQSVDHFRSFVEDPHTLARIAVHHALSDIYASGGQAVSAMAMITLPFAKPGITRSLLRQVMDGTLRALAEDGVLLLGGHTSEGPELSIGFAVNGYASPDAIWRKQGLHHGDKLILTKPLGTGTLFAADMQMRAKGQWVMQALDHMLQSNRAASEVLSRFDISACTDVTGFGLAGHALEMTSPSTGIAFSTDAIPLMLGADETLAMGITSTLHRANEQAAGPVYLPAIMFDPQTSGGLLAGVPARDADACVTALRDAGYKHAAVIGEVVDNPGLSTKSSL